METEKRSYDRALLESLPVSKMVYPNGLFDRIKYFIFLIYSPMHGFWRDLLLKLHIIYHHGRQDYLFGTLKKEKGVDDFIRYLTSHGFGNHFVAWRDDDEIASLRMTDGFKKQYHLRIFNDGEIRGHYEFTPEAHPIKHLNEVHMREGRDVFMKVLDGWIDKPANN